MIIFTVMSESEYLKIFVTYFFIGNNTNTSNLYISFSKASANPFFFFFFGYRHQLTWS